MLRRFAGLALVAAIVLCAGAVIAQETYELKGKQAKGDKETGVSTMEFELTISIPTPDGSAQNMKMTSSTEEKYAEEILEAKDGKIVKAQRKYHFSRETSQPPGAPAPSTETTCLHGKLYEVAMTDGKAAVKCLNAKLGDEDKKKIENAF
ncbi:MAG: hypothetical protein RDV41_03360, partial [Planctomycetota bacterium]|nr:hypothetical protein [Planctomycetota bacterium]